MATARRLILENKLGQQVRTFRMEADELNLIYRLDSRRVEGHTSLAALDKDGVDYKILKTVSLSAMQKSGSVNLKDLGQLRLLSEGELATLSPTYNLAKENDKEELALVMKKSAIGHLVVVALMVLLSVVVAHFTAQKEEPQLVTIVVPKPDVKQPEQHVQVADKKITPMKTNIQKIANKTVIKKVQPHTVAKKVVTPVVRKQPMVVRSAQPKNLANVGALAALGGVKNGTRGYEGLDTNSLKNIRSAGVGSGGGGVGGSGAGGMKGVMAGRGLIAGSAGSGGRAESAGGYGTKGAGGGRAGYGKISLVGNTSGISLPLDDEATVEGGLDKDAIAAVINRNKGQIIYCYEQGLQGQPSLSGRVDVDFVIGAVGRITKAKIGQSSLGSRSVEECMIAKMKTWQFPHPVGNVNVDVQYPFELRRVSRL